MKGKNTLVLNQATMREAVQMYLDDQMKAKVVVCGVERKSDGITMVGGRKAHDSFIIEVEEPESTEGAPE